MKFVRAIWKLLVGIKDATVAAVQNGVLVHRFPPASVTRLQFALA